MTRLLCITHWLGSSVLIAAAAFLLTRSAPITLLAFMQAALHLTPLAREPGHPQELVAVLLALAAVIATRSLDQKWTLPLLIVIGAGTTFTKINVGVFYGLSLLMALMSQAEIFRSQRWAFCSLLALACSLPFVLMRQHLSQGWAQIYSSQVCVAVLSAAAVAYCLHPGCRLGFSRLAQAGAVFFIASCTFVVGCVLTGSTLASVVENLVTGPAKLGSTFCIPLNVPHSAWSACAALLGALAVVKWRTRLGSAQLIVAAAKAVYGLIGALLVVTNYNAQLGYLLPWTWLLLVPTAPARAGDKQLPFARIFLSLAVAWQSLQAYPVPGTQAVLATLLQVLAYSVCLSDAMGTFANTQSVTESLNGLKPRVAALLQLLLLAGLFTFFATKWCDPVSAWRYYAAAPKLGLAGASHLHLPPTQVQTYQALTQFLETQSDCFITLPGLNSLYFWTGKKPPTYFNISEVVLLNNRQQIQVVSALRQAKRPMVVVNSEGWHFTASDGPLRTLVDHECKEVAKIGPFQILELAKNENP